jgi:hypothetical protein
MQIQVELSFADFLAAQRLHATRSLWGRLLRVVNFYIFPAFGVCMLCLAISIWRNRSPALVMLACSLVLIGYPAYYRFKMFQCYKRTRSGDGACSLTFEESGIRMVSANSKSEMNWSAFRNVRQSDKVFLLYVAPGKFVIIPKRVSSAAEIGEISNTLANHVQPASTKQS